MGNPGEIPHIGWKTLGAIGLNRHDPQHHRASKGDTCNDRNRKGVCFTLRFHQGVFMSMFLPNMKVKMICIS